jgi:hypothetical protein
MRVTRLQVDAEVGIGLRDLIGNRHPYAERLCSTWCFA